MAKRKHRGRRGAPQSAPELTGVVRLLSETPVTTLDLHGLTGAEAVARVHGFLRTQLVTAPGKVIHVITGRGTRSEGAAVLPGVVRELLEGDGADHVAEYAGLMGGGGFAVRVGSGD